MADIVITTEEYNDEESVEQKIIFDNNVFQEIRNKELDLSVEKVLKIPLLNQFFKRSKEEYYVVSQKEHIIDCKYTKGKAQIPILNKRVINQEIQQIKSKAPIKYVQWPTLTIDTWPHITRPTQHDKLLYFT